MTSLDLSFHTHTNNDPEVLRSRLEAFRRTHRNADLPFTIFPWDTAWSDLVRIALYKDGADVSEIGTTWLGSFVGMEALRPFTLPELYKLGGAAAFLPVAWQNGALIGDQTQWGIPWLVDTRVVFYWRDMLEHAGIDESTAFQSPAQLQNTLACLQASGISTPWAVTTQHTPNTLYNVASWIWSAGGDFTTPDGTHIALDQAASTAGLRAYFDLYRFMPQTAAPIDDPLLMKLFMEQRIAALMSGSWFWKDLHNLGASPYALSHIGVALPPGPAFAGGTMLAIWRHIRPIQDQAAVELIQFLSMDTVWQDFYWESGMLPARLDVLAQPPFSTDPHYQAMIQALQHGRSPSRLPLWGLIEERLTMAFAQIWAEIQANPDHNKAELINEYLTPVSQRLEATLTGGGVKR